jgi:actin-related protein
MIFSEPPLNSKVNREKMIQIMFETFNVPAYFVFIQEVLSLYSSGRTTGLVLDSGDSLSFSVPIYEGHVQSNGIHKLDFAGKELTDFMMKLLTERGIKSIDQEISREIKEKFCYISLNGEVTPEDIENTFKLPDGNNITLANELFKCPEALFRPEFIGLDIEGFHQNAFQSIEKCDVGWKKELFSNIVISGGSTVFKGFSERMNKEMTNLSPSMNIKIVSPSDRKHSSWIGGSVMGSQLTFNPMMISKKEYDVDGPSIVHRKCF